MRSLRQICATLLLVSFAFSQQPVPPATNGSSAPPFGFRDFARQSALDKQFVAVPDPALAREHLRILTAEPHIASSPEDKKTAEYVAEKFRAAGLQTQIVEYRVWMGMPKEISVDITAPAGVKMHGPTRESVGAGNDPFQDDPRVVTPFNGDSPSGEAEADVVYANYGSKADFQKLKEMKIDLKGKIVIVRYGQNYRGVKSYLAEENGCAGVLIYSDPIDDGYFRGDKYPKGPWRPDTGVQRGSVQYLSMYPGDPTTPGVASLVGIPDSKRVPPEQAKSLPKVPTTPISYADAQPILANLGGPESPREWQGALPFTYHVGPGPVRVKMNLKQDFQYRPIWDVIGMVPGSQYPNEWVIGGNHRDAWVYGAVDPNSGTAAMLEAAHGIGQLLKTGWKPKRTIVFGSWDAEEEGLIGSTEWVEEHEKELANAAAYFNMDVGVSGPRFGASSVPSLKQFVRDVTKAVPSASGEGSVYDVWNKRRLDEANNADASVARTRAPAVATNDVAVGDLGSGSDYTPFFQHAGIPATDIGSSGSYGVYHSVFDNFAWFTKFGDPTFIYEQQMARVFGVEMLHMAQADVLPYDYALYGHEVESYLAKASAAAQKANQQADFASATTAAHRFAAGGEAIAALQHDANLNAAATAKLNTALRDAERAFLLPQGLPKRPWFRHAVYAPGEYTGYAAVVIPGVNEAIDAHDQTRLQEQINALSGALNNAAKVLEECAKSLKM